MTKLYAHIFNGSRKGSFDLYVTETPCLVGSSLHSTHNSHPEARAEARKLGAKPWNYIDVNPNEEVSSESSRKT